jgi:hypothetical protein
VDNGNGGSRVNTVRMIEVLSEVDAIACQAIGEVDEHNRFWARYQGNRTPEDTLINKEVCEISARLKRILTLVQTLLEGEQ